jgi:hypothetical protein
MGMVTRSRRWFYGWVVAAASALGIAGSVSVFIPSTMALLVGPLGREWPAFASWAALQTSGYGSPLWLLAALMAIAAVTLLRFKPFPSPTELLQRSYTP